MKTKNYTQEQTACLLPNTNEAFKMNEEVSYVQKEKEITKTILIYCNYFCEVLLKIWSIRFNFDNYYMKSTKKKKTLTIALRGRSKRISLHLRPSHSLEIISGISRVTKRHLSREKQNKNNMSVYGQGGSFLEWPFTLSFED